MEYYSERCADWLEKNNNIHPDKLNMEINRFQSLLNEAERLEDQDSFDDLQLTVQLLSERLATFTETAPHQSEASEQAPAPSQQTDSSKTTWDTTSLTHHGEQPSEILDSQTKAQRKSELLKIPGIQLGTSALKNASKETPDSSD